MVDSATGESCRFYEKPLNWNSNGVGGVFAVSGPPDFNISGGASFPADNPDWTFEGPTALVTVSNTQSILANISGLFGREEEIGVKPKIAPQFAEFGFGVCFQNTVGGGEGGAPVVNMNQSTGGNNANFAAATYDFGEQDYTGIGVAAPGAGTYNVGYCIDNYGDSNLNNNNWVNGYVEVVDGLPIRAASRSPAGAI